VILFRYWWVFWKQKMINNLEFLFFEIWIDWQCDSFDATDDRLLHRFIVHRPLTRTTAIEKVLEIRQLCRDDRYICSCSIDTTTTTTIWTTKITKITIMKFMQALTNDLIVWDSLTLVEWCFVQFFIFHLLISKSNHEPM